MAVTYSPVSQRSSPSESRRGSDDVESQRQGSAPSTGKSFPLTVRQRQLVGMLIFAWLICLWVALKAMEASHSSRLSPLLSSTNALLDTNDLYHTLTLPLLQIAKRTKMIGTRCGSRSLEPHLLSFLSNDLFDPPQGSAQTLESHADTAMNLSSRKPSRYLFAIVLQDSEMVLPDLLSRILEVIAVLGPDHCHLSIVNHGSTDGTGEMLMVLTDFLDLYNQGGVQSLDDEEILGNGPSIKKTENYEVGEVEAAKDQKNKAKTHHLTYSVITLSTRDESLEGVARTRNMAVKLLSETEPTSVEPTHAMTIVKDKRADGDETDTLGQGVKAFDTVVMLDPVVTCAEDILELLFQSRLQNADLTCGMDLDFTRDAPDSEAVVEIAGKPKQGAYDSSIARDIIGLKLHNDTSKWEEFSIDQETQTRFQKRLPFQAESCWSGAVVLRASALLSLLPSQPIFRVDATLSEVQPPQNATRCDPLDDRASLCQHLWVQGPSKAQSQTASSTSTAPISRIVIVPAIGFTYTPKDYVNLGRFSAWGLWSRTEKQYRDALEAKFETASHKTMYGYKPSTASYGYISRVEEDETQVPVLEGSAVISLASIETPDNAEVEVEEKESLDDLMIPEDTTSLLKSRLEEIMAVFGVQDIQDAIVAKRDADLIREWRQRPQQPREC